MNKNTKQFLTKAVIIDDELPVRRALRCMLSSLTPVVQLVGEADNVQEGLSLIEATKPDLIFLDIKMPVRNGFELLDELAPKKQPYGVIFISGYPEEAVEAVRRAAPHFHSDFIIKPVNPSTLREKFYIFYEKWKKLKQEEAVFNAQLNMVLTQMDLPGLPDPPFLVFQNPAVFHRIEIADIMYCESAHKQINIYCSKQDHLNVPNITLDGLSRYLPPDRFIRAGKSHIINKEAITYLEKAIHPVCRLILGDCIRDLTIYASNIEKIIQSYRQTYSI